MVRIKEAGKKVLDTRTGRLYSEVVVKKSDVRYFVLVDE